MWKDDEGLDLIWKCQNFTHRLLADHEEKKNGRMWLHPLIEIKQPRLLVRYNLIFYVSWHELTWATASPVKESCKNVSHSLRPLTSCL